MITGLALAPKLNTDQPTLRRHPTRDRRTVDRALCTAPRPASLQRSSRHCPPAGHAARRLHKCAGEIDHAHGAESGVITTGRPGNGIAVIEDVLSMTAVAHAIVDDEADHDRAGVVDSIVDIL